MWLGGVGGAEQTDFIRRVHLVPKRAGKKKSLWEAVVCFHVGLKVIVDRLQALFFEVPAAFNLRWRLINL